MPIDALQSTLATLMESGTDDNPALNVLLSSYTRFHLVLVVVGGLFLLALALFSVFCWRRFTGSRGRTFERRTYFWFALLGTTVALLLAVVVAGNVSNALDPRPGFSGSFGLLAPPPAGTPSAALQESFTTWLRSGRPDRTAQVTQAIGDRLAWQRPKAIVCGVLLVLLVRLSVVVWRTLIRRSRVHERGGALLLAGVASVPVCLLLMVMVMGNTQASLAPVTLTLLYG